MSQVELLYRFQQVENEIRQDKQRLIILTRSLTESEALLSARQRNERAALEVQRWRTTQTDLNLELASLNDKANRSEKRLYSGTLTNPKELGDLQHEVEALGRRRAVLEDELLEAMINLEDAQEEADEVGKHLVSLEAIWEKRQNMLMNEQAELVERLNQLIVQRKQHLARMSPEAARAYEDAARRAGPVAVAALQNGRCLGCQVSVPAYIIKAADEGQLVTCDNCTRILYLL